MLLKAVPCFTMPEPPALGAEKFFLLPVVTLSTCAVTLALPAWFALRMSLRCTYPLLKYTDEETTEVVGFTHFLPKFA